MTVAAVVGVLVPKTAFAAINDYGVSGGDPTSLPIVGAASVPVGTITLVEAGGDDFSNINGREIFTITLNASSYSSVIWDSSVVAGALTVSGTCGHTSASAILFTDATSVEVTVTGAGGAGFCTDGQTVTIGGLKISTINQQNAPAATYLISVDNKATANGSPVNSSTTVAYGTNSANAAASIALANNVVGATQNTTVTFTNPVDLSTGDTVVFTMPANVEVVGTAFVSTTFMQTDGVTAATFTGCSESAQVVTCTTSSTVDTQTGNIVMSGMSAASAFTGSNEVTDFTVNDVSAAGADIAFDAMVEVTDTLVGALSATSVALSGYRANTTNTATVTFTTGGSIPATGLIKVTFGSGFTVSGATSGACTTMDGAFATSVSGSVVTLTRSGGSAQSSGIEICTIGNIRNSASAGSTGTYTISTTIAGGSALIDTNAAVGASTITSASSSSSSSSSVALTYDIAVSAPVATAAYSAGDDIAITWSTLASTGTVSAVNLSYSTDGGITNTSIVSGTANDGSYTWMAPSISASSVTILAQATDLIAILDTGISGAFSIGSSEESNDETADDTSDGDTDTSETSTTLLPTGAFFKGESWSTVYYVGADGTRRPFLDAQTFFTYADNFDSVIDASDDYLANYAIGTPMMPKAGTVLVKVVSVNNVYALEADDTLRWITSESVASSLYGSNWADFVIDVPVTAWGHFTFGADIDSSSDISLDGTELVSRDELNSK